MIRPLVPDDAAALAALASRRDVVRAGVHDARDPVSYWQERIGAPDATRRFSIALDDKGLRAALLVELAPHRRRTHVASLCALAPDDDDHALERVLTPALDMLDRWTQTPRVELTIRADHPRVDGLLARHGLVREVVMRNAVGDGRGRCDLAVLGRLRAGFRSTGSPVSSWPRPGEPLGGEVRIRPVVPADGPAFAAMMSEPSVVWGTMQFPLQRPDVWGPRFAGNDRERFFVYAAEHEGAIVGNVALIVPSETRRRHVATLGMSVSERAQGRGLGRRLLGHAISLAKDEIGLERIELEVYADNARAIALYESHGFVREGCRSAAAYRDGGWVDDHSMALCL